MKKMRRMDNYDWTIMNANAWISGKNNIQKIIQENNHKGTIMVVQKDDKPIFILGTFNDYGNIGELKSYRIDTGNGYRKGGDCRIENIINIDENQILNFENEIGLNEKRRLYVFK